MRRELVYDLPTRIFHWLFAGTFLTAYAIAKTVDDDSAVFSYHMLLGLILSLLVAVRIIWGIWGTKHARFSDFALNPKELMNYFRGILSGSKKRWAGHNPATSWAAILMMGLAAGLGLTGYLMTSGTNKETFEDVHELLANSLMIVAILHIAGNILQGLRHKETIGLSMLDGRKADIAAEDAISSQRSGFGALLLGVVVVFALHLYGNFDAKTRTLKLLGTTLQLGESDDEELSRDSDGSDKDDDRDEGGDD